MKTRIPENLRSNVVSTIASNVFTLFPSFMGLIHIKTVRVVRNQESSGLVGVFCETKTPAPKVFRHMFQVFTTKRMSGLLWKQPPLFIFFLTHQRSHLIIN